MKAIRQGRGGRSGLIVVTAALAVGMHACSSGSTVPATGTGGVGGLGLGGAAGLGAGGATGGAPGMGGASTGGVPLQTGGTSSGGASSGGASSGGMGGASSGGMGGASSGGMGGTGGKADCAMPSTTLDPSMFPVCPQCMDKPAHCLPNSIVMQLAADEFAQLAACDSPNVCVPDVFIKTLGKYDAPTCSSISNAAGRCLSECIGTVAKLGSFLPKGTCGDGEKCAPCIDPRNGMPTGACTLECDTGPQTPAPVFDKCCSDMSGLCVPPSVLAADQAKALAQDTCSSGNLCAPAKFADGTFVPKTCDSVAGAEGRCVSKCVDLVKRNLDLLPKDVCADDELCAPCTDPRNGELTGACSLNGDKPTKPPVVFRTQCCAGTGLCVPHDAVPDKYSKLLPPDICADADGGGADYVCAPTMKLNDLSVRLPKCQATLFGVPVPAGDPNQFGACIPQCIADAQVAMNPLFGSALAQSDCMDGWVCAPCINPLDMTRTGACD